MLIILEGPDCVGKTTLCDLIVETLVSNPRTANDTIVRPSKGPPSAHALDEYERPLLTYRPMSNVHVICDRWHLGEYVYPRVLKRSSTLTAAVYRHVAMFLKARGAVVVLLNDDAPSLAECVERRGDDIIRPGMLSEIVARYDALPLELVPDLRFVNFRSADVSVTRIIDLARRRELHTAALRDFVTYVGPPNPSTLLLGDTRGAAGAFAHTRMPAFMPYPSTCGAYMLEYINALNVGLANACDVDDPVELWKTLGKPSIVTLGRNAHRQLSQAGVLHSAVPHPQFIRRFHHAHGNRYADVIFDATYCCEDMLSWRP